MIDCLQPVNAARTVISRKPLLYHTKKEKKNQINQIFFKNTIQECIAKTKSLTRNSLRCKLLQPLFHCCHLDEYSFIINSHYTINWQISQRTKQLEAFQPELSIYKGCTHANDVKESVLRSKPIKNKQIKL